MEKSIVTTGKTIDLAIASALNQLGLDRDSVSVTVLQQAKSGFLGFGVQPAKVQVTYEAPDPVPEKQEAPKSALGSASRSKPKAPAAPVKKPDAPKQAEPKQEAPKAEPPKSEKPAAPKQEPKAPRAPKAPREQKPEKKAESKVTFCAGRDIAGNVITANIAKMPHLFVGKALNNCHHLGRVHPPRLVDIKKAFHQISPLFCNSFCLSASISQT